MRMLRTQELWCSNICENVIPGKPLVPEVLNKSAFTVGTFIV
jgi:hypothetical protein